MIAFYIVCAAAVYLLGAGAVGGWLYKRYDKDTGNVFCPLATFWPVVFLVLIGMWLISVATEPPKPCQKERPW